MLYKLCIILRHFYGAYIELDKLFTEVYDENGVLSRTAPAYAAMFTVLELISISGYTISSFILSWNKLDIAIGNAVLWQMVQVSLAIYDSYII